MDIPVFKFALDSDLEEKCKGTEFKPEDFLPKRMNPSDTGWDVRAAINIRIKPMSYAKIPIGLCVGIPEGYWLDLRPRSSTFFTKLCHAHNGTIDNSFIDKMRIGLQYIPDAESLSPKSLDINFGDRLGQLIPVKLQHMAIELATLEEIQELNKKKNSTRTGGFGSTGDK